MSWEVVIGVEIHIQMKTNSKLMCNCDSSFSSEPNTHICPVCTGQPGMLPVINKQAVENAIMLGLAIDCNIRKITNLQEKTTSTQIYQKDIRFSQYDKPICEDGKLEVKFDNKKLIVGITRIHMEEECRETCSCWK